MRVLVVDASDRGGIAAYSQRLVEALRSAGVDARLAAPPGRALAAPSIPHLLWGYEVAGMGKARLYAHRMKEALRGAWALATAVRSVRPDVVHVQTSVIPRFDWLAHRVLRRSRPLVVTAHDAIPLEGGADAFRRQAKTWRAADAVIVHGEDPRLAVTDSAPGRLVRVVPVDLNLGKGPVERHAARARLGIGEGKIALLFGLLRPYKGLGLLGEAWPSVADAQPDARLLVVGDADHDLPELERLRRLRGVEVHEGFVPEEDIDAWVSAADVLVLPYTTGTHSGVLNRGLGQGTPVLASPALSEEVVRTGAGSVVPLEPEAWTTAILEALGPSPLPTPRPTPAGQETVKGTLGVYRDLLAARGAAERPEMRRATLRILHVVDHVQRWGDGIVNCTVDLACAQAAAGHTVAVGSAGGSYEELLRLQGVQHIVVPQAKQPMKRLRALTALYRASKAFRPDIVHVHHPLTAVLARALNRRFGYRVVATVHNEFERKATLMRAADRVVGVSEAVASSMVRRGTASEKVRVVLNGPLGSPRMTELCSAPVSLERPALVCVAGMTERKGIGVLLDAFELLGPSFPEAHLYLVGSGPDGARFRAQAQRLAMADRIHFEGFQRDPHRYLREGDVCVLASLREPFGVAVIEAREAGCALVVSDVDGLPEAVDHGEAGCLVPPGDSVALARTLERLLANPGELAEWKKRAAANLERFTAARMCEETLNVYRELVPD